MKTYFRLIPLVLILCWGCGSDEKGPGPDPTPTPPPPEITFPPAQATPVLDTKGGTASMTFTATASWDAAVGQTRADSWCTVSPTKGDAGTVTLTITATENTTPDERNTAVTLRAGTAKKVFTITQKQKDALTVTSAKIEAGAAEQEITIEVKANISFEYEIDEASRSWITAVQTRAMKTSTLKFRVAENTEIEKREGYITIRNGELSEKVTVYQEGSKPSIVLTKNEYQVKSEGETIAVELKSNTNYEVQMPQVDWITEKTTRAYSSHTHHFTVAANETYDSRSAEILFTDKDNGITETVKVSQLQLDAIVLSKHNYEIGEPGGVVEVEVASNIDYTISIKPDWIKETVKARGLTNQKHSFTVDAMTEGISRKGEIVFTNEATGISETVTIEQQRYIYFQTSTAEVVEPMTLKLACINNSGDKNLIWESSDTSVATVASDGTVTGVKKGSTIVTVYASDRKYKATCEVTVKAITNYISLSYNSSIMQIGSLIYKSVSSTISNNSPHDIKLLSFTMLHPVTNDIMYTTTDPALLGVLQAGAQKPLGMDNLREDIDPVPVWEYSFGGNRYTNNEKTGGPGMGNPGATGEDMPWQ